MHGMQIEQLIFVTIKYAAMELFDWLEDNHPMREDWNTVTMEHGLSFVIVSFHGIEEAVAACRQLGYTNPSKNLQLRQ